MKLNPYNESRISTIVNNLFESSDLFRIEYVCYQRQMQIIHKINTVAQNNQTNEVLSGFARILKEVAAIDFTRFARSNVCAELMRAIELYRISSSSVISDEFLSTLIRSSISFIGKSITEGNRDVFISYNSLSTEYVSEISKSKELSEESIINDFFRNNVEILCGGSSFRIVSPNINEKAMIQQAVCMIANVDILFAIDIALLINQVVFYKHEAGSENNMVGGLSCSTFHFPNTIYFSLDMCTSAFVLAEQIVHETMHSRFMTTLRVANIFQDSKSLENLTKFYCPWRNSKKNSNAEEWDIIKAFGAFHVYVYLKCYYQLIQHNISTSTSLYKQYEVEIKDRCKIIDMKLPILYNYLCNELTPVLNNIGRNYFDQLSSILN